MPKRSDPGRLEKSTPAKGIDKGDPGYVFKLLAIEVVIMEVDTTLVRLEHDARPVDHIYISKKEIMEMAFEREMASTAHIMVHGDVLLTSEDLISTIRDILARDDHKFYLAPYLNNSIDASRMLHGKRHQAIRWIIPNSSRQRGSWEYGYYVMKWMVEIISFVITERWQEASSKGEDNPSSTSERTNLYLIIKTSSKAPT